MGATDKPTERALVFKREDIETDVRNLFGNDHGEDFLRGAINGAHRTQMLYEAKLCRGELRVVKKIPRSQAKQHVLLCSEHMYDAMDAHFEDYIDFCPGCGAAIVPG